MMVLLAPLLAVLLTAGPIQFSGAASIHSECGWVAGGSLVEPRAARQMRPQMEYVRPMNRKTYDWRR